MFLGEEWSEHLGAALRARRGEGLVCPAQIAQLGPGFACRRIAFRTLEAYKPPIVSEEIRCKNARGSRSDVRAGGLGTPI